MDSEEEKEIRNKKIADRISLVVWWLRICLPM